MRVFSTECPRVNSNYTFLQESSQPETGKEESHGWLTVLPLACASENTNTHSPVTGLDSEFSLKRLMSALQVP